MRGLLRLWSPLSKKQSGLKQLSGVFWEQCGTFKRGDRRVPTALFWRRQSLLYAGAPLSSLSLRRGWKTKALQRMPVPAAQCGPFDRSTTGRGLTGQAWEELRVNWETSKSSLHQ